MLISTLHCSIYIVLLIFWYPTIYVVGPAGACNTNILSLRAIITRLMLPVSHEMLIMRVTGECKYMGNHGNQNNPFRSLVTGGLKVVILSFVYIRVLVLPGEDFAPILCLPLFLLFAQILDAWHLNLRGLSRAARGFKRGPKEQPNFHNFQCQKLFVLPRERRGAND